MASIRDYTVTEYGTTTITSLVCNMPIHEAGFGPFRYVVIYNEDPTSPADPLVAYWDYGSSVSCVAGKKFKVDFGASVFTLA